MANKNSIKHPTKTPSIKIPSQAEQRSTACAACRYYRRRCAENCVLAPYFPRHKEQQFINAHKLYGANNIIKTLNSVPPELRDDAMTSIIYSADVRAQDPVGGCKAIVERLQAQLGFYQAQLNDVRAQLDAVKAQFDSFNQAQILFSQAMPYSDILFSPDEDKKPILDGIMKPTSADQG